MWRNNCSQRRCSIKNSALKDFAIFTAKHLYWSLFITKRLQHKFSCEYWEILNPIQDGVRGEKDPRTSFSPVTSTNV